MHIGLKARFFIIFVIFASILASCHKDERQAEKSIKGAWNIVSVFSEYGSFMTSGFDSDSSSHVEGDLGSFIFSDSQVEYEFQTKNDTYSGSGTWDLEAEKINSGFTRVTQFTIRIENDLSYFVEFGDQTSNAEKDASSATLISIPEEGYGVQLTMQIEKQ